MNTSKALLSRIILIALVFSSAVFAQKANVGTIAGRVYNSATGEYVRNAEIGIPAWGLVSHSEDGGAFVFADVPEGVTTVHVSYTGYTAAPCTVEVKAGQSAVVEFSLVPVSGDRKEEAAIMLSAFVVSTEREGNAKAIMEQRKSQNILNSVASDVFGDIAEGNVAEFLRNMPGVDIYTVAGEARNVRLRGLSSEYTGVTIDGMPLASADANTGANAEGRTFSFEQVSLNNVESIEVLKTVSADLDANAPAGTINHKMKRAFDRKGRRVSMQLDVSAFGDDFSLSRTQGPNDARHRKMRPGGIFEYSDVFMNGRLGVILNLSESNVYSAYEWTTLAYSYAATTADPRPATLSSLTFWDGPRINEKFTTSVTMDFKATSNLTLSLSTMYNTADLWYCVRQAVFTPGTRANVAGTDPLMSFTSASNGTLAVNPLTVAKFGRTVTFIPGFEYKKGRLTVTGRASYSDSKSWYDPLRGHGSPFSFGSPTVSGVSFRAQRSSLEKADWKIEQVGGPDWSDGANYTNPVINTNDGRSSRTKLSVGQVSASLSTRRIVPVVWKAGLKMASETRDYDITRELMNYSFSNGARGALAPYASETRLNLAPIGASVKSSSGTDFFMPSLLSMGTLFTENPSLFTPSMTAANFYNGTVANHKHYEEDINAAFVMATAKLGRVQVQGGLRWEDTKTDSLEFDPLLASEVIAAGYPVTASTGRASTIPGLEYQYFSNPKVHRKGAYDNYFPSCSLKYNFTKNLDILFGYSSTIRRPAFRDVSGVWTVNETTGTVSAPNVNLKPEKSDNFSSRIAYYFEPVGVLAASFYQNEIDGLFVTQQMTAEEFGYNGADPELLNYSFSSTTNSEDKTRIRGWEFEYSQSLSFLPGPFRGLGVRFAYTRNSCQGKINPYMTPHFISTGFSYSYGRFSCGSAINWNDETPITVTGVRFYRHRTNVNFNGTIQLSRNVKFSVLVRNAFNAPQLVMEKSGDNPRMVQQYTSWGTSWTFSLKSTF